MAVSRATETLIFLDTDPIDGSEELSSSLLGEHIACAPDDLLQYMSAASDLPEDLVLSRIRQSRDLLGSNTLAAWNRATQAVQMLGKPDLPNGVGDPEVRREAYLNLLAIGARLISDGTADGPDAPDTFARCRDAALLMDGSEDHLRLLDRLREWTKRPQSCPIKLLEAALEIEEPLTWLGLSLVPHYQAIQSALEMSASDSRTAALFRQNVENWLSLAGYAGNIQKRAAKLRLMSLHTLLSERRLAEAAETLRTLPRAVAATAAAERAETADHLGAAYLFHHARMGEKAMKAMKTHYRERIDFAMKLIFENRFSEAIEICHEIETVSAGTLPLPEISPVSTAFVRANALIGMGRHAEAMRNYDIVTKGSGKKTVRATAYFGQACILYKREDLEGALRKCVASLNNDASSRLPGSPINGVAELATLISIKLKNYHAALVYGLIAHRNDPENIRIVEMLVPALHALRNHDLALKYCELALNQNSEKNILWFLRAMILAAQDNYEEAAESVEMIDDVSSSDKALKKLYYGYFLSMAGQRVRGIIYLDKAIDEMGPINFMPLLCRAEIHELAGREYMAMDDTFHAASCMEDGPNRRLLMLESYYKNENLPGVVIECRALIEMNESSGEIYMALGHALSRMQKEEDAWQRYSRIDKPEEDALPSRYSKTDKPMIPSHRAIPLPPIPESLRIRRRMVRKMLGIDIGSEAPFSIRNYFLDTIDRDIPARSS